METRVHMCYLSGGFLLSRVLLTGRCKTRVKLKLETHVENIVVVIDIIINNNSIVYVELDEIVLQIHICSNCSSLVRQIRRA